MPVVALVGPNAVGKTTAVRRWCKLRPKLVGCLCDSNVTLLGSVEEREPLSWKRDRERVVAKYKKLAQNAVVVVESASGYGLRIAQDMEADHWLVVTCSWQASLAQRLARCERLGKVFNTKTWHERTLGYESERRQLNYAESSLLPDRWTRVVVEDQEKDWPVVDELFGRLYRRYYNVLVRARLGGKQ